MMISEKQRPFYTSKAIIPCKSMLTVAEAAKVAQHHKVPLIVDAAEEDLFKYTEAGADLVIYSGAKAIEGPSAGLVVGKKNTLTGCAYKAKALVEQ